MKIEQRILIQTYILDKVGVWQKDQNINISTMKTEIESLRYWFVKKVTENHVMG